MKKRSLFAVAAVMGTIFAGSLAFAAEKVKLEFFQNKPEAVKTFDKLIAEFEKANPTIDIEQNNTPDPDTVIKTRVTTGDIPEIMALGGSLAGYGDIASTGVLKDFSKESVMKDVLPAYFKIIGDLHSEVKGTFGIPYSANANTVLYNKDKFKELGLTIPKIWNEFIKTAETIKAKGQVPFYHTYKDAWTLMVPFNSIAANVQSATFIKDRKANKTTFVKGYADVAEKMIQLSKYGHKDQQAMGYNEGNTAFAKGESVMYIQGVWAINTITGANPNIKIGAFAMPVSNDAKKNKLVSGVDTVLTMSKTAKHPKEAMKFIKFLLEKKNAQTYIDEQKLFSTVKGVLQNDPSVDDLKGYFVSGNIAAFPDHSYPAGMQAANLVQEFIFKGNKTEFLKNFDNEWDKVTERN